MIPYAPRHAPVRLATVALLAVTGLAVVGQLAVWIPLTPAVARTYGMPLSTTATAGTVFAMSYAVGELLAGPIADRRGRRPVLLVGLVGLAATSLAAATAPTWTLHLVARIGQGVAAASFAPVAAAWLTEALPAARRASALALLITAYQASVITGQLYGQIVAEAAGWRTVYASLAALYLLAALALAARLRDAAPLPSTARPSLSRRARQPPPLQLPALVAAWLLSAVLMCALIAMYTGLEAHLPAVYQARTADLLKVRVAGLFAVLLVPLALTLVRTRRSSTLVVAGISFAGLGLCTAALVDDLELLVAGSVLTAVGITLAMSPLTELIGQVAPATRASVLSVQSFMIDVGAGAGAAASARLAYPVLCALLAIAVTVGALAVVATAPAGRNRGGAHLTPRRGRQRHPPAIAGQDKIVSADAR